MIVDVVELSDADKYRRDIEYTVADDGPIEPNEIADVYDALSDLHDLVSRLAAARESITGEAGAVLPTVVEFVGERRAEFGEATAARNPFTLEAYRAAFG